MRNYLLIGFILITGSMLFSQSKVGTTAANFLTIPVSPRAAGMGSAFTAIANDATAAYWNPGGLSRIKGNEFSASFTEWLVDTKTNWFGVSVKLDDNNAVALSFNQLDYGEEEITTADQQNGTGEYWGASDFAVGLSYARNLTDRFSIGGSFKYINQKIWNESASAFALDIGLLFYTQLPGFTIGMNISNFGTEMQLDGKDLLRTNDIDPVNSGNNAAIASKLDTDTWPLPLVFAVGVSYNPINSENWNLLLASDAVIPNNQSTYGNFGAEITWSNLISLRGGYSSVGKEEAEETFSAGVGLQYDFGGFFAKIDYGYSDFGIFGGISRYSLSVGL